MIVACQTPLAETQQNCILWLERYFETYGDQAPNRDETHLLIMEKGDLFALYEKELKATNRPTVNYSRFIALWNTAFPTCINRPWCDIPGKCDTCYEIDRQRRTTEDAAVQTQLKHAHQLHRGGMFMLERNE